jgi:predicted RecB family endonuclease
MKKINAKEFLELDETAFHDVTFRSGDVIKIHIEDLYKIMEQYHQSKVNNVVSDDVIKWQMHMKVEKIETLKLSESMTNKQIDEYFENACGGVYKWWRE